MYMIPSAMVDDNLNTHFLSNNIITCFRNVYFLLILIIIINNGNFFINL